MKKTLRTQDISGSIELEKCTKVRESLFYKGFRTSIFFSDNHMTIILNKNLLIVNCNWMYNVCQAVIKETPLPFDSHSCRALTASGKSHVQQFPAFGHSVIRGLVTNRLIVRRELCNLRTWITALRAHIVLTQIARTLK